MNKRTSLEYQGRNELRHHNWDVNQKDCIAFNSGSESFAHFMTKATVGYYLKQNGWRVDSEVENKETGAIADIVAYGKDQSPFVVEIETNITEETKEKKLQQFYRNEPFVECYILEVLNAPENNTDLLEWINEQLPGEIP